MAKVDQVSRRSAIKAMGGAAVASCAFIGQSAAQEYRPQEQSKLTQAAARYQDKPRNSESCASCPYFIIPNGCVVVEGQIAAEGWCPMYTQFSPMDRGAHI